MEFRLENTLSIAFGVLLLVITIILSTSFKSNKHVNIYLVLMLLSSASVAFNRGLGNHEPLLFSNYKLTWIRLVFLTLPPSAYLYLEKIYKNTKRVNASDFIHFIIPILWSILFLLQTHYLFLANDTWNLARKIFSFGFTSVYFLITLVLIRNSFKNQDTANPKHIPSIKNWVLTFFILISLVQFQSTIHFCFELEEKNNIYTRFSFYFKMVIAVLLSLKLLTSPEIIFGYPKLAKSLKKNSDSDATSEINNKIIQINNEYFIRGITIDEYFTGKNLECLRILLDNKDTFIPVNSFDELFISEFKTSVVTLKKRREQSLKAITFALSYRLNVPEEFIFITTPYEIDKRMKLIKLNPDLLS